MVKLKKPKLGHLPPQYKFSLNPYPDLRFSRCPNCSYRTSQRKLPLLIQVQPSFPIVLNMFCRYCPQCDTLICHKDILEHILTSLFKQHDPAVIGNDYFILGTVEKRKWKEGFNRLIYPPEMVQHLHDFKTYEELRMTERGWFPINQEPPIKTPPLSTEWIKSQ